MIPFSFIVPAIALATFIPAYASLYAVSWVRRIPPRYLAAAGVGLAFWYFFDTTGDAAALQENNAVYPASLFGGLPHILLIGCFVAGLTTIALLDNFAVRDQGSSRARRNLPLLIPLAVALVMGVHSLGEGWDAVSGVSTGPATALTGLPALVEAYGTFPAVVSYPLHKFLEATIVAVLYLGFVIIPNGGKTRWWEIPVLGLFFAGPSTIGAAIGYFNSFDTTYFFAFSVASALYAALRLAELASPRFDGAAPTRFGLKTFVALVIGFLLLYGAALLH